MTEKIQELLGVLDMPKEELQEWWQTHFGERWGCKNCLSGEAFRLRDEVFLDEKLRPKLREGMQIVTAKSYPLFRDDDLFPTWWMAQAQPIHWIIAALIAKELNKKLNFKENEL